MRIPYSLLLLTSLPVAALAQNTTPSWYVIDTHADTPQRFVDEHFDMSDPLGGGNLNLDAAKKGRMGAQFFSIWVDPDQYKGQYAHRTLELIDAVRQQVARHPEQMSFATTPAEIEQAQKEHKLASLMGIEGGHSIEDSIPLLRDYYALGVRYMTLTWSNSIGWADSSSDIDDKSVTHTKEGLTEFGKDVVYEMNRLGMMVDISHVSDRTFYRTLVISRAPVIASHSSARALNNVPRNMSDEMILAVARSGGPGSKGGVVQVNFYSDFLSPAYHEAALKQKPEFDKAVEALKAKAKAEGKPVPYKEIDKLSKEFGDKIACPPLSLLIDHIDHIAKLAGVDHVGIGADFDGVDGQLPQGIDSAADYPKIADELTKRGYSEQDIAKIMGGNLLRVFREVEDVAAQLQKENRPRIVKKQPIDKW